MGFSKKKTILISIVIIIPLVIIVPIITSAIFKAYHSDDTADKYESVPPPISLLSVNATKLEKRVFKNNLKASGVISAWQEIIVSSELEGLMLEEVYVEVGDKVKKGQVLASYNSQAIEIELNGSKAIVEELRIAHDEARINFERAQNLHNVSSISEQELQRFEVSELRAAAQLKSARAQVNKFKLMLEQANVLAPDDGTLLSKFVEVGSVTQVGQELFRMQRQSRVEWLAEVDVNNLNMIRQKQVASITLQDGLVFNGKVRKIAPEVSRRAQYGLVYVDLPNSKLLLPGMFVSGEFEIDEREVLALPRSATQFKNGFSYVKVIEKDSSITERKIIVGEYFENFYEVISGLQVDEVVVKSGAELLGNGDYVTVVNSIDLESNLGVHGSRLQ
ncbi:efflux RND transporter periplasmic adaptor subunit [Pseudoalteromonas shioyasakiensis]|nr:efflux RND transporter periplasmic adaptor subunit [Pseudoalteromonas shioyasakiensis]